MSFLREKRRPETPHKSFRNRNPEGVVSLIRGRKGKMSDNSQTKDTESQPNAPSENDVRWDEMLFEKRNRAYGAYVLRKGYVNNLSLGLALTVAVVIFLIGYPAISKFFFGDEIVQTVPPRKLVYTELSAPPPIDKPKAPPPQIQLPRLQKVIKFVPPKVVKENIAQEAPTIDEIRENQTSSEQVDGPAQIVFDEPVPEVVGDDNEIFTVVDQQPEFEGGYEALIAFIQQNMKYPANARRLQIEGTVHVSFIVDKTGAISDVKVLHGIMRECDQEAVRVVQMMPAWRPGKQNGHTVNVRFILPLKFRLH